jgi:hypothetical protein
MPRLCGRGKLRVDYRHSIDWLVRKPGAFANYRYRSALLAERYERGSVLISSNLPLSK